MTPHTPDLQAVIRDLSTQSKQTDDATKAGLQQIPGGPRTLLLTFAPGTRVLDLVTGETGVVLDGKRENVLIPPTSVTGS